MRTIQDSFEPDSFRDTGHRVVDLLADYLRSAQKRAVPVLPTIAPEELLSLWDGPTQTQGDHSDDSEDRMLGFIREVLNQSNHVHHPGYMGHQVAVPLPAAALIEMVHAVLNNGMAVYEMGQLQTVLERRVVEFLAEKLGLGSGADGVFTHGGSLGNLTALLAARQANAGYDVWTHGQQHPMSVLVSEQAHYCIARSVQTMGWGAQGAWPVNTDEGFRMSMDGLHRAFDQAQGAGRQVIAVAASACSTATGSFDPIPPIADFCDQHGLWLHVDGAHGASLALSQRHRHRLTGIERADSVVWDLHKMMGMPALSTAILFREGRRGYGVFSQDASYLFDSSPPDEQWFNPGHRTLECTKRGMGATAYGMLKLLGCRWFEDQIDALMERTAWLESLLRDSPDFELACAPQANIVCFRHIPLTGSSTDMSGTELDQHQARLREAVVQDGSYYIVQTHLHGRLWLRTTLMNPMTTRDDINNLVDGLHKAASRLIQ